MERLSTVCGKCPKTNGLGLSLLRWGATIGVVSIDVGKLVGDRGGDIIMNSIESTCSEIWIGSKHNVAAVGFYVVLWIKALDVVVHSYAVEDVKAVWRI